jgi:hypothetical protein
MKKILCLTLLMLTASFAQPASAQGTMAKYEYAIVKWDGPDYLYENLPGNRLEIVRLEKIGITVPKEHKTRNSVFR